jgi:hypothetical protein
MLLRNESKVCNWIRVKLIFDDNSIKELDIHESDYVHVVYRKNGCKESVIGAVVDINPYIRKCACNNKKISAIIKVDASKEFNCEVVSFDMNDIIDITKLIPTKCCCCHCGNIEADNSSDDKGDEVNGQEEA